MAEALPTPVSLDADALPPKPVPPPPLHVELIAGSVGGAAQVIVGHPLDTIKVRAQTAPPGMFKGPWDVAVKTVQREGVLGLYKGLLSPLLGIASVNSLLFFSYSLSRRLISPYGSDSLSIPQTALAGALAGGAQSILASPVELFKIRMQAQYTPGKRLSDVAREEWAERGLKRGVFRGFWVTVAREIPAYAGFYAAFETSKRAFKKRLGTESLPVWALLTSGSTGGIAYWLASYPFDVVKSRVQLGEIPATGGLSYIPRTIAQIANTEGTRALFRGLTPTLIRSIPAAASTFVAFELTRDFLIDKGL